MTIKEVMNTYQFDNVGQFRGIAQCLGYKEEYNKGFLCFTLNGDEFRTSNDEIRAHTRKSADLAKQNESMERVCKFFDKDSILSNDTKEPLYGKEGLDIVNWGDIGSDNKDRFTMIDHKNRICYTGKNFYEYALNNGYLLDGKGTKLEKGVLSDITEVKGKPAKLRMTNKGVSVFYRKEALVIPNKILGKKLSEKQRKNLLDGEIIVFPAKKGHLFVQVDRDLNSVIIRSEKEIAIPAKIGDRELTAADKYLLANGHSLDNMILFGEEGYFMADVSWTGDKKGIAFSNVQALSATKAKELLAKQQENDVAQTVDQEKSPLEERDMEAELKDAVAKDDYEKMAQLKEEGYKPSEEVIKGLSQNSQIDEKKAVVIEKLFGVKPEEQEIKEMVVAKEEVKAEEAEVVQEVAKASTPELDADFKLAVENGDFAKLDLMKTEGYMPTKEAMQFLSNSVPENSLVAVQKIFGLKSNAQSLGDVKLAQSPQTNSRDMSRGLNNVVNRAFSDL